MNSKTAFGIGTLTIVLIAIYQQYSLAAKKAEIVTKFEYTVKNEINVVDYERSMVSFEDFNNYGKPAEDVKT